jgi:hypothetical protein
VARPPSGPEPRPARLLIESAPSGTTAAPCAPSTA